MIIKKYSAYFLTIFLILCPLLVVRIESKTNEITIYPSTKALGYELGWAYNESNIILTSPAFMDSNQDGQLEIIICDSDGYVYCLNSLSNELWKTNLGAKISASPAIADINNDKNPEIIIGAENNNVYCLNNDGTIRWSFSTLDKIVQSPMIIDLNKDSYCEILVTSSDKKLYCLNKDGLENWQYSAHFWGNSPAVGDVNGDSFLEILFYSGVNLVKLDYNGNELGFQDMWDVIYSDREPVLADIDNNGDLEIYYFEASNIIMYSNPSIFSRVIFCDVITDTSTFQPSPIITADLTNDGHLELLFSAKFNDTIGYAFCYDYQGNQLWNFTNDVPGLIYNIPPTVADLDNDLDMEIIIGSTEDSLYCLDHLGNKLWQYDKYISNSPLIIDLDNDNCLEIIIPLNEKSQKLVCLELTGVIESGGSQWSRRRGNDFNTGQIDKDCDFLDEVTEDVYDTNSADSDSDTDGLTDGQEVLIYFTKPNDEDTDDDQLEDGDEIELGTNPFETDSDTDGISDGQEVFVYETDPLDSDSDDDGYSDGEEILENTDPLDPEDYPGAYTPSPTPSTTPTPTDSNGIPVIFLLGSIFVISIIIKELSKTKLKR